MVAFLSIISVSTNEQARASHATPPRSGEHKNNPFVHNQPRFLKNINLLFFGQKVPQDSSLCSAGLTTPVETADFNVVRGAERTSAFGAGMAGVRVVPLAAPA